MSIFVLEALSLIAFSCFFLVRPILSSSECTHAFNDIETSFDVSRFQLDGQQLSYYTVRDIRALDLDGDGTNILRENYTYFFNVCDQIFKYPEGCSDSFLASQTYCTSTELFAQNSSACTGHLQTSGGVFGYAYQKKEESEGDDNKCWYLSGMNGGPPQWSLYHEHNPSEGVILTYTNGGYAGGCASNRQMRIHFLCENDADNIPNEETVTEIEPCVYQLTVPSLYGCPIECGVHGADLCANNGLCGYDFTNNKSQCFCYFGLSGNDCSDVSEDAKAKEAQESKKEVPTGKYVHTLYKSYDNVNTGERDTLDVTYDLSNFYLPSPGKYNVTDPLESYYFLFNILGLVPYGELPMHCEMARMPCLKDTYAECEREGASYYSIDGTGMAFQLNAGGEKCFLLGTKVEWQFYDQIDFDPARGVGLLYTDGGYCFMADEDGGPLNRQFLINLVCPNNPESYRSPSASGVATVNAHKVTEVSDCKYEITIESSLACPYQCKTTNEETGLTNVCSGKGMCAADPYAGFVRCLCDDGLTGADCTQLASHKKGKSKHSDTGFHVAIAIISIFLVVCLVSIVYLLMRHRQMASELLSAQLLRSSEDSVVRAHEANYDEPHAGVNYNHDDSSDDNSQHYEHERRVTPEPLDNHNMPAHNNNNNNKKKKIGTSSSKASTLQSEMTTIGAGHDTPQGNNDANDIEIDNDNDEEDDVSNTMNMNNKKTKTSIRDRLSGKGGYVNANQLSYDDDGSDSG